MGKRLSDFKDKIFPKSDPESYFRTDHLNTDLKGRSIRGGVVTIASQIAKFLLQLGSTAILARLLTPKDYGLMGMVYVFINFISLFQDLGLSAATIQKDQITHNQVSNLFWVNVGLSTFIMLLTMSLSPVIAWFYGEPRLISITIVLACAFIFGGLTVQHQALLKRQMRFSALAIVDIISMLVGIIVAIAWAFWRKDYWALVMMQLAMAFTTMVGVWLACGWRPGLPKRYSGAGSLLSFGGHLTGFNLLNYLSRNLDNILIGWKHGAEELGMYAKAYQLLLMPFEQINRPVALVALPTLSRLQSEPERYLSYYNKAIALLVTMGMPLVVFMFVAADKLILTILGGQWKEAILIFRLLAPAAFVSTFNVAAGWVYISLGRTDRQLRWGFITSIVDVISFVVGVQWGAIGVATAYSISRVLLRYPAIIFCYQGTFLKLWQLNRALWKPTVASLTAGIALYGANLIWQYEQRNSISMLFDAIVYTVFYFLCWVILPQGWQTLKEMLALLKALKSKS